MADLRRVKKSGSEPADSNLGPYGSISRCPCIRTKSEFHNNLNAVRNANMSEYV
jgi:hypothetical protein